MIDRAWCLDMAIEITKAHATSAAGDKTKAHPEIVLERVYNKLTELAKDAYQQDINPREVSRESDL